MNHEHYQQDIFKLWYPAPGMVSALIGSESAILSARPDDGRRVEEIVVAVQERVSLHHFETAATAPDMLRCRLMSRQTSDCWRTRPGKTGSLCRAVFFSAARFRRTGPGNTY